MKRIRSILVTVLVMAMVGGLALAQDDPGRPPRRRGDGRGMGLGPGGPGPGRMRGAGGARGERGAGRQGLGQGRRLQEVLGQLELTEAQKAKIDAILQAHNAPMREAQQAMREARESGDQEAIQAAREKMRELRPQRGEGAGRELLRQIAAVLTKSQRERFLHLMGPAGPFEQLLAAVKTLQLSPAQARQIRVIAADAKAKASKATEDRQKVRIYAEARRKVMDLLTDEQKAELRRRMARNRARGDREMLWEALNLSPEQQKAVEAIRAEVREQMEQADSPEARREATRSTRRRIFNEVLTEEQQEQFREQLQQRRQRLRERGPRGEGEGDGQGRRGRRRGRGPNGGDAE